MRQAVETAQMDPDCLETAIQTRQQKVHRDGQKLAVAGLEVYPSQVQSMETRTRWLKASEKSVHPTTAGVMLICVATIAFRGHMYQVKLQGPNGFIFLEKIAGHLRHSLTDTRHDPKVLDVFEPAK
ncbi:MAG: hypothetical protein Q9182_005872 [Xanthomendoza sp. 2 TL-2023]